MDIGPDPVFGVFFDGTNNNKINAVKSAVDDDSPTNVAKLYEIYNLKKLEYVDRYYQEGVGTITGKNNDTLDSGFAYTFGRRLQEAINETQISFKFYPHAQKGIIDVFGFSRGAAAARAFVNEIHRITQLDPTFWGGLKPEFRFVGLFDTVGSVGMPGDNDNDNFLLHTYNDLTGPVILDIHEKAVKNMVHLTAGDEVREYFPLSSIKPKNGNAPSHFFEEQWPGAHSDIGGGYGSGPHTIYFPHVSSYKFNQRDLTEEQKRVVKADVIRETLSHFPDFGRTRGINLDVSIQYLKRHFGSIGKGSTKHCHVGMPFWIRKTEVELSHVALKRMHELALKAQVPFDSLDLLSSIEGEVGSMGLPYEIPDDIKQWVVSAKNNVYSTEFDNLYRKYIHHSHQYEIAPGDFVIDAKKESGPEFTARNGEREIFYNNSNAAIDPDNYEFHKSWDFDEDEVWS